MVEQWTHKPLDVGSNPTLATIYLNFRIGCGFTDKAGTGKSHPRHYLLQYSHWMWVYR